MMTDIDALAADYRTIAIEGCDGAGKTTLANRLATKHGFRIVHSGPTPPGRDLQSRYRQILAEPGRIALDRCFISELVYGRLFRRGSRLSSADITGLCHEVADRSGALVHVTASTQTILRRLRERGEHTPESAILAVQREYVDVLEGLDTHLRILTYPTDARPQEVAET